MWIFIWLVLAVFVIGFVGWTTLILMQQKKAWAGYAKKHGLTYVGGNFMDPPTVYGELDGLTVNLSTVKHVTSDVRGQRLVTAISFDLGEGFPTGAAIGSPGSKEFIESLSFEQSFDPKLSDWKKEYVLKTRSAKLFKPYLTKERQEALHKVLSIDSVLVLFFFDELEAVFRIETPKPFNKTESLDRIMASMLKVCNTLRPTTAELDFSKERTQKVKDAVSKAEAELAAAQEAAEAAADQDASDETEK